LRTCENTPTNQPDVVLLAGTGATRQMMILKQRTSLRASSVLSLSRVQLVTMQSSSTLVLSPPARRCFKWVTTDRWSQEVADMRYAQEPLKSRLTSPSVVFVN